MKGKKEKTQINKMGDVKDVKTDSSEISLTITARLVGHLASKNPG